MRILVLDNITRHCVSAFKFFIAPELPKDVSVDYACGWQEGLRCFKKKKYDLVVVESLLAVKDFDYSRITVSNVFRRMKGIISASGRPSAAAVHIPGLSGEKISNILIRAYDCIGQMQAINPRAQYVVCCHLRSGYSKKERERLSRMNNVLAVLNSLSTRNHRKKILKLVTHLTGA